MLVNRQVNGQTKRLPLEEAVKHTLTTDAPTTAYNNLIRWQANSRGEDLIFLGLMIEKCEKRAKEMGIEL